MLTKRVPPDKSVPNEGRDYRTFRQGEVYLAADEKVAIPDSEMTGRTFHGKRPVLIVSEYPDNDNPDYPLILVAPISSSGKVKTLCDVEVSPTDTNGLERDSYVKVGLIQPILKVYLGDPAIGILDEEDLDRVLATLDIITGAELPELTEEEVVMDEV